MYIILNVISYIAVEAFRAVTPCSVAVGYRRFGRPCRFHLHFTPSPDHITTEKN